MTTLDDVTAKEKELVLYIERQRLTLEGTQSEYQRKVSEIELGIRDAEAELRGIRFARDACAVSPHVPAPPARKPPRKLGALAHDEVYRQPGRGLTEITEAIGGGCKSEAIKKHLEALQELGEVYCREGGWYPGEEDEQMSPDELNPLPKQLAKLSRDALLKTLNEIGPDGLTEEQLFERGFPKVDLIRAHRDGIITIKEDRYYGVTPR